MTGFGRTGRFFAMDHISLKPDLFCLSKGLTGGAMALGVTSCTLQIYNAFLGKQEPSGQNGKLKTFFHGHSFTANPVACACALASLDLMEKALTWNNIERIIKKHEEFLVHNKNHPKIKEIRQQGTILAIVLNSPMVKIKKNAANKTLSNNEIQESSYFNSIKTMAYDFFLEKGIILRPLGNVIYIIPPYCISNKDLKYIYSSIIEFANSL